LALLFIDGFDHYATADILKKWDYINKSNRVIIDTGNKKSGTSSLRLQDQYGWNESPYVYKNISAKQTVIIGFMIKVQPADIASNISNPSIRFYDSSSLNIECRIIDNCSINVYRNTTLLGTSSNIIDYNIWVHFQIKVVIDSINGSVEIKKDGEDFYSLTGINTQSGSNAWVNRLQLMILSKDDYSGDGYVWYDDLYIADDFQGVCIVDTKYPNGAGNSTQWTPSTGANFECVDEVVFDNTDQIASKTVGQIDTFNFEDILAPNDVNTIKGVQHNIFTKTDDIGYRKITPIIRPSTSNIDGTELDVSSTNYKLFSQIYNTNPETSQPWTISEVNATEFGVKVTE